MQNEADKSHSCFASMSRFLFVFESFLKVQMYHEIYVFLVLQANLSCLNCLAMVHIIIALFPSLVF